MARGLFSLHSARLRFRPHRSTAPAAYAYPAQYLWPIANVSNYTADRRPVGRVIPALANGGESFPMRPPPDLLCGHLPGLPAEFIEIARPSAIRAYSITPNWMGAVYVGFLHRVRSPHLSAGRWKRASGPFRGSIGFGAYQYSASRFGNCDE